MDQGWNLFSVNVTPVHPGMDDVMEPVLDDLVIVKDGRGRTCIPEFQINDIGDIDPRQGYKAYLSRSSGLTVEGIPVDASTAIGLSAGWNMIGFLPDTPIPVETALAGITALLVIAKNGSGDTYLPQYGINTIGSMEPGQGYQVYLSAAATLVYPSGTDLRLARSGTGNRREAETATPHFGFVSNTGENATVVVPVEASPRFSDGTALAVGDEIGILASGGRCCGAAVWEGRNTAITVWGDDAVTDSVDGFLAGDTLRLTVWKAGGSREYAAETVFREGDPVVYVQDGLSVVTSLVADLTTGVAAGRGGGVPADYGLSVNYPNPFNSETVIEYRMPGPGRVDLTVYDLYGRPVRSLARGPVPAGFREARWDGKDEDGREAASGVYYCRIRITGHANGGFSYRSGRKMILIR
jgi:hypothetical protein